MFQLFSRKRAHQFVRHSFGDEFRARSSQRDAETDRARIEPILAAIGRALGASEDERSGLSGRVDDVLARAAITGGTATDEYLDREPHLSRQQALFDKEIANGERRLTELSQMISHLKCLKAELLSRFSDLK